MLYNYIEPESREEWLKKRTEYVTSTEVSALFGLSPYMSRFELWHQKKDKLIDEIEENERMFWGKELESSIAGAAAKKNGWAIRPAPEFAYNDETRMGSSFDYMILRDAHTVDENGDQVIWKADNAILEIKNVDSIQFAQKWQRGDADNPPEAPPHIELQVQHQMALTGHKITYIAALVGGNSLHIIERKADEKLMNRITQEVGAFWQSITDNRPPSPDWDTDAAFIIDKNQYASPGKEINVTLDPMITDMVQKYKTFSDAIKQAETGRRAIKAALLERIGDAEKCVGDGFSISARMRAPTWVEAHERKGGRDFRVTWRKVR